MSKKKELIYESALNAFANHGYSYTTMDAIAVEAKVAKGTLYYHFKTKEELFLYVNQKGVQMLIDSVGEATKNPTLTPQQRIVHVLDEHLRFFSENEKLCTLLLTITSGDFERDVIIRDLLANYFSLMESYLGQLQQNGLIDSALEIQTLVSAFFGSIAFTVLRKMYRKEEIYTDDTRNTLLSMCKGVLGVH